MTPHIGKSGIKRVLSSFGLNRVKSIPRLTSQLYSLHIPLSPDEERPWKPHYIFNGRTKNLQSLSCHVSVLIRDHCPHLPHTHSEEELLLLFTGEVDLILPQEQASNGSQQKRLKSGQFVYYPAHFPHTLQTVSEEPANYLLLKWRTVPNKFDSPLTFGHFDIFDSQQGTKVKDGFFPQLVFEGPTDYLRRLHCHTSTLTPGTGYDPHMDAHDVVIIILEGEVETLSQRVKPHSVIFYAAGEPHGMVNSGQGIAKYLVFEFHGTKSLMSHNPLHSIPALLTRLTGSLRWGRQVKALLRPFS